MKEWEREKPVFSQPPEWAVEAVKNFKWTDQEKVIQSFPGKTNWNAIDPNLIVADDGTPYLTFGSFWDGLKLVKLNNDATKPAEDINSIPTIPG